MTSLPIIDVNTPSPSKAASSGGAEGAKGKYSFISLGCPKNLVDSERMLGLLDQDGYQLTQETEGSDFVVINTCGFIERARDESFAAIEEMLELKRQGKIKGVIVSGCLAERQKDTLLETCPEIDQIVGVFGREEITRVADRLVGKLEEQRTVFKPAPVRALNDRNRLRITPRHFSYLKISEGCDRLCTFCAIPKMRGKHATKPMEEVIAEAEELSADGVREVIVVAQDTTYYGMDLYGESRLAELLSKLNEVQGIDWIRLMYFYPMYVTRPLLETIAACDKIVPYVDIPLQHINDTMLRRMARRVTRSQTEELIGQMREIIPGLNIRTTFITGFPGETDEQFLELADFIQTQRFERAGVFTYSKEEGTPAVRLDDHLPDELMEQRREHLMAIQQEVMFEHNEAKVGTTLDVLIDQPVPGEKTAFIGRTVADAPDVDCVTYVTGQGLKPGDIVPTEIVMYKDYDLVGVASGPARQCDTITAAQQGRLGGTFMSEKPIPSNVIVNVPNVLTGIRFALSIVAFVLLPLGFIWAALAIFIVAVSTDWMDGYWARKYNQVTKFGRIFDPFVDKIIICGTFVFLVAIPGSGIAAWVAVVVMGREMLVTVIRSFVEQHGGDFSANWPGKWKMVFQCASAILSMVVLGLDEGTATTTTWYGLSGAEAWMVYLFNIILWGTVGLTLASGWIYVVDAVRMIRSGTLSTD